MRWSWTAFSMHMGHTSIISLPLSLPWVLHKTAATRFVAVTAFGAALPRDLRLLCSGRPHFGRGLLLFSARDGTIDKLKEHSVPPDRADPQGDADFLGCSHCIHKDIFGVFL